MAIRTAGTIPISRVMSFGFILFMATTAGHRAIADESVSDPAVPGSTIQAVGLIGSEEALWAYCRKSGVTGATTRFTYHLASDDDRNRFFALPIPGVTGRIALATVRRRDLHVMFGDGTHRRFTPGSASIFRSISQSAPVRFVELNLPRSILPAALTCDAKRHVLYAVVTARQAAELPKPDPDPGPKAGSDPGAGLDPDAATVTPPDPDSLADSPESGDPTKTTGESAADPSASDAIEAGGPLNAGRSLEAGGSRYVIVRYSGGAWYFDRPAPEDIVAGTDVLALLAADGVIHIFYEAHAQNQADTTTHRVSASGDTPWTDPTPLPTTRKPESGTGAWINSDPALLLNMRDSGGLTIAPFRFSDGAWLPMRSPNGTNGQPVTFHKPFAATIFDGQLTVAGVSGGSEVRIERWSLTTGEPTEPAHPLKQLASRPVPPINSLGRILLQYAILLGVLTLAVLWRRDRALLRVPLKPTQTFARFPRRGLAMMIDLGLLTPIWAPILYYLMQSAFAAMGVPAGTALPRGTAPPEAYWSAAILGGIFGLYAFIFEASMGATPGKRILGLSVVADGGAACRIGQIAVRNVVRVLEFHFPPLVILMAMTPSRQRLGDLFARTVVVETHPTAGDGPPK